MIRKAMCGADLKVFEGASTTECEYCGSVQTLPKVDDEVVQNLFNRANNLRIKCEFDKAEQVYEKILHENDALAEAHWGIVLCKYGIEYVEDPKTYKRIPCYKDMDAYDLPEEFSHLQAQDMSKIGFINDVVRGIKKVTVQAKPQTTVVRETVVAAGHADTTPLLKRAFMFLEDGDWKSADEYCEKVLDLDPECAMDYVGKLMAGLHVKKQEKLRDREKPFDGNNHYQKALRFADEKLKADLTGYIEYINTRNEKARLDSIYTRAKNLMSAANTESKYREAAQLFESIAHHLDSAALAKICCEKAQIARKDAILADGKAKMTGDEISNYEAAIKLFAAIPGWRDADEKIIACQKKIEEIKAKAEAERIERERREEEARKEAARIAKRNKKILMIAAPVVCAIIAFVIVLNTVIIPNTKYNDAMELMDAGKYAEAAITFGGISTYQDAKTQAEILWNQIASRESVSAGEYYTVGLKSDGTVAAVGYNYYGQCDVSGWKNFKVP